MYVAWFLVASMGSLCLNSRYSSPGIAMPKSLYFNCHCNFSSFIYLFIYLFLFSPIISFCLFWRPGLGHWTDLIQPNLDAYSLMSDCYLINLVRSPPCVCPYGLGEEGKKAIGPMSNFDRKYLCNRTWYQQLERNWSICRDSHTCLPNLVNFAPQNGWERLASFCKNLKFARRTSCRLAF